MIIATVIQVMLSITPTTCLEPCSIKALITLTNVDPEREVCIGLDGPKYTKSCWPHNGRKMTAVTIKDIPAGEYDVFVEVQGKPAALRHLSVLGDERAIR